MNSQAAAVESSSIMVDTWSAEFSFFFKSLVLAIGITLS